MSKTRRIKEIKDKINKLRIETEKIADEHNERVAELRKEGIEGPFIEFFVSPLRWQLGEKNAEIEVLKDQLFYLKHDTTNYITVDGETVKVWEENGSYTGEFAEIRHFPLLYDFHHWECTKTSDTCKKVNCTSTEKIRMSEIIEGSEWNGEPLKKYMRKSQIEKIFKVKMKREDLKNFDFIAGFYNYDTGFSFRYSVIIDVLKYFERYKHQLIKKHGDDFFNKLNLKIP